MNDIKKIKADIKAIAAQNGVHQFVLINPEGCIIQQEITRIKSFSKVQAQSLAKLIITIKNSASVIGKDKFKTFTISRKNGQNIFIFPIGKFYMGVIKSTHVDEPLTINDPLNALVRNQLNTLIMNLMTAVKHK